MAIRIPPAKSNAERQREFRERNPGYYARLKARERAAAKRGAEQILAQRAAAFGGTSPTDEPRPQPPTIS